MAVLQTLRTKFGLAISIIVALGLLSFIIDPGQIQSAVQSMSSKYDVGEINGKSISYTDFQADVERYTTLNELMTGKSASSEEEQVNIRNTAWQSLIDKYLLVKEAKAAGNTKLFNQRKQLFLDLIKKVIPFFFVKVSVHFNL